MKLDKIQLNTLDRPCAEQYVMPLTHAKLKKIALLFPNAEIILRHIIENENKISLIGYS